MTLATFNQHTIEPPEWVDNRNDKSLWRSSMYAACGCSCVWLTDQFLCVPKPKSPRQLQQNLANLSQCAGFQANRFPAARITPPAPEQGFCDEAATCPSPRSWIAFPNWRATPQPEFLRGCIALRPTSRWSIWWISGSAARLLRGHSDINPPRNERRPKVRAMIFVPCG